MWVSCSHECEHDVMSSLFPALTFPQQWPLAWNCKLQKPFFLPKLQDFVTAIKMKLEQPL